MGIRSVRHELMMRAFVLNVSVKAYRQEVHGSQNSDDGESASVLRIVMRGRNQRQKSEK